MDDRLPRLYSLTDLGEAYDIPYDTMRDLIGSGQLVAFKIGRRWRVALEDWERYIERQRAEAAKFSIDDDEPHQD
jgi:excisionase family DNA binding protein